MTAAALTWFQIAILTTYSVAMSLGQVLFKLAARRYSSGNSVREQLLALALNWYFLAALLLYCGLAVLWVWILSFTPLSRAYPFVAIAFFVTPMLGSLIFGEPLHPRALAGIVLILCELVLVTR